MDYVDDVVGLFLEFIVVIVGCEYGNIIGDLFIDCIGFVVRLIG